MSLIPRDSIFDFEQFMDNFFSPMLRPVERADICCAPRVDIRESKKGYEISAEMPGVNKDDLKVTLDSGVLTVEAETRQEDLEEKEGRIIRQERRYGKWSRSFNLGADVGEKDIDATFKDGVLTLKVPKVKSLPPSIKRIDIH
jgi:HSP20 family protein